MRWFRKHLRHGSRLALFALAIQFGLSFGHFHGIAAQAAPSIQTSQTDADLAGARDYAKRDAASETAQRQQPAAPDTDHHTGDVCAICAVMALAGTVLVAAPPLLELPQAVEFLYRTTDAEFVHLRSVHPAFRSRAPPAS